MSSSIVSSFGGSFFKWFQDEVLPYLLGTVIVLVIIVSCVLNVLLIVTLKKRDMMRYPCNRFVLELSVLDLVAVALVLVPSLVSAFAKTWYFGDYFCYVHAGLIIWFHLVTFGLLAVMFVERMVKITNKDLYIKVFNSSRVVSLLSALVWIFTALVTGVAASPWLTISYNFYHAACVVNLDDNIYYTAIVMSLGMVASLIVCIICIVKIFKSKKKAAEKESNEKKNSVTSIKEEEDEKNKLNGGGGAFGALLAQTSNGKKDRKESTTGIGASTSGGAASGGKPPKNKLALMAARKKIKRAVNKTKVTKLFSLKDDNGDPNIHMMVTYIIVWIAMLICHAPYFSINIADFADSGDIWGGYYSITVIFFMVSYCLKPIIYLTHNRNYRKGYKETMPETVIEKANTARKSVSNFMDKIDKAMFKTPGKKKLDATLNTHMAANKWLRKVKNKKGAAGGDTGGIFGKLKPKPEAAKDEATGQTKSSNASENVKPSDTQPGNTVKPVIVPLNNIGKTSAANTSNGTYNPRAVEPLPKTVSSSPVNPAQTPNSALTSRDVNLVENGRSPTAERAMPTAHVLNETSQIDWDDDAFYSPEPIPEGDAPNPSNGPKVSKGKLKSLVTKHTQWRRLSKMAHVFEMEDGNHDLDMV